MSTRTITYDLTLISGSAAASKVVTFDLLTPLAARSADTVVQVAFSSTADENGAGTVTLAVPSSGAYLYNCTLPDGQSFRFSLAAGDATTLHALMAATVGSTVTAADAITTAVDAAITTHNALTTNVHGIADTSDIEPALGNPDADGYVLSSTTGGTRSWVGLTSADISDFTTAVEGIMLADATAHGTRSTSGDGTAVIAAPSAGNYIHILGGALTVDNPGTDAVTIIIKSGSTAKYEVTLDAEAVGIAMMPQIVCADGEAVIVNLSANVNVNYTLSYKTRTV